jgi:hypothetical protein
MQVACPGSACLRILDDRRPCTLSGVFVQLLFCVHVNIQIILNSTLIHEERRKQIRSVAISLALSLITLFFQLLRILAVAALGKRRDSSLRSRTVASQIHDLRYEYITLLANISRTFVIHHLPDLATVIVQQHLRYPFLNCSFLTTPPPPQMNPQHLPPP